MLIIQQEEEEEEEEEEMTTAPNDSARQPFPFPTREQRHSRMIYYFIMFSMKKGWNQPTLPRPSKDLCLRIVICSLDSYEFGESTTDLDTHANMCVFG